MLDPPGVTSSTLNSVGDMCDKITIEYNHSKKENDSSGS